MIYEITNTENVAPLFDKMSDTTITSCLQGIMGKVYADSTENPHSAMAILGDFCFLAGEPNEELALYKPPHLTQDFMIMMPENEAWCQLVEKCYKEKAKKVTRYALQKDGDVFDRAALQAIVDGLSPEFTLTMIDEELFHKCGNTPWCKDWVANFPNYELYRQYGLGVTILKDGEPIAGASSYSGYREGIEIEIVTKEEYRRQGLASVCGAKLILECLKRGLYPSWDAQNKWSAALAQKLGYHYDGEYTAYEIWDY